LWIAPNQPAEPVRLHGPGYGLECPWRSFHIPKRQRLHVDIGPLGGADTDGSRGYHPPISPGPISFPYGTNITRQFLRSVGHQTSAEDFSLARPIREPSGK